MKYRDLLYFYRRYERVLNVKEEDLYAHFGITGGELQIFDASGTNQTMMIFTKLKFQDFAKFGWPLLIISWILCIAILPQVFPFF